MHFDLVTSKMRTEIFFCSKLKKNCVRGAPPPKNPSVLGMLGPSYPLPGLCPWTLQTNLGNQTSSPNQLVIGYHWLAFLNSISVSEKAQNLKMKILLYI